MNQILQSVLLRFARAFVAGAVANMSVLLVFSGSSWEEVKTWMMALTISGIVGGIAGVIMALDKYLRSGNQ